MEKLSIGPAPGIFTSHAFASSLRERIPQPQPQFKERFYKRKSIFQQLNDGNLFENYPAFISLFFNQTETLNQFLSHSNNLGIIYEAERSKQGIIEYYEELRSDFDRESENIESSLVLPHPKEIYEFDFKKVLGHLRCLEINTVDIAVVFEQKFSSYINMPFESAQAYLNRYINPIQDKTEFIKSALSFIGKEFKYNGDIIIATTHENSKRKYFIF